MFLNHETAFQTFAPVTPIAAPGHSITASGSALLETETGWKPAHALKAGDSVATLDGGFASIRSVSASTSTQLIHVPGGTLGACTDVLLPATASVALHLPASVSDAPVVSVQLQALCGWRGIRRAPGICETEVTLTFDNEEMVYAQTGLLLHTDNAMPGFFQRKSYGETRALLALWSGRLPAPDYAAAA